MRGALIALLRAPLWVYRKAISPVLGPRCRYVPTCSCYMDEALRRHGPGRGLLLGLGRIARCHPFACGPMADPVPERFDWRDLFRYKRGTKHKNTA